MNEELLQSRLADPTQRGAAFNEVVRQYSEQLYWHIRHIVVIHEDADDVLQNTFLKAWRNINEFEGKSKISTWLYRIAVNESLDFLRHRATRHDVNNFDVESFGSQLYADTYFDGDEAAAKLQAAVETLPPVQQAVFRLRYFEDMKYSEMSELLNTSEGALKANYHHAMNKVIKLLS